MHDSTGERDGLRHRVLDTLRDVQDFPKPGIGFKDITPVLADAALLRDIIAAMAAPYTGMGITHVAGIESRGFILASPIAIALGAGFIEHHEPASDGALAAG